MNKFRTRLVILILTFAAGIFSAAGWIFFQKSAPVQLIVSNARWERILFRDIDDAAEKAQLPQLRTENLSSDDIEVRIWRGFGLSDLEAVFLKRTGGSWTAVHLKADGYIEPFEVVRVKELGAPKSGWESFWNQMIDRRLLDLPDAGENDCSASRIDGMRYVVEVNQNRTYRTYHHQSGVENCSASKLMDEIGEIIGLEFEAGVEQCQNAELFACIGNRRRQEQKNK